MLEEEHLVQSSSLQGMQNERKKRPACDSLSEAVIKRARAMMSVPDHSVHAILNILQPGIEFNHFDKKGPCHAPTYITRVVIKEQVFEGVGRSKKAAKLDAAEKAIKTLLPDPNTDATCTHDESDADHTHESSAACSHESNAPGVSSSNEAAVDASEVVPAVKGQEPMGISPVAILSNIRPGIQYFSIVNSDDEKKTLQHGTRLFKMGVIVDGKRFEGSGMSKKLAKLSAAEAGLREMFELEFSYTSDGVPVFTGDKSSWSGLKKTKQHEDLLPKNSNLPWGKHPLQLINELYPNVVYTYGESPAADGSGTHTACIKVEETHFEGKGSNRKLARLNAAVEVINFLKKGDLLEQRFAEKRQHKKTKPKWHKPQRAAFLKSNGKPFGPPKPHEQQQQPKDAVVRLKEVFGWVDYQVVSESRVENGDGESAMSYQVSAVVMNQTFTGDGESKKKARLKAAEAAMCSLGLWTAEDENMKQEATRQEKEKAKFERLLYGTPHSKGSYVSRDWREAAPLVLPNSKDGDISYSFEDSQDNFGSGLQKHSDFGSTTDDGFDVEPLDETDGSSQNGLGMSDSCDLGQKGWFTMGQSYCFNGGGFYDHYDSGTFTENTFGQSGNWWGQY